MNSHRKLHPATVGAVLTTLILLAATSGIAQKKMNIHISATATGTSTQLGRMVSIDIHIFEYSHPEDQKALLDAFAENKNEGLVNAVEKMRSKGRIAITGTIGYDLKYIRLFKMPDGSSKIRFVTDRDIKFGEHWGSTRTLDYRLSMGEIILSKTKGKNTGTLMPGARLFLDKKKEIDIETYQNPWKLINIRVW